MRCSFVTWLVGIVVLTGASLSDAQVATPSAAPDSIESLSGDVAAMRARGIAFLKAHQSDDGSFSPQLGPGVTALVTFALLRSGLSASDPDVSEALAYLEKQVQADGGIGRATTSSTPTSSTPLSIDCDVLHTS